MKRNLLPLVALAVIASACTSEGSTPAGRNGVAAGAPFVSATGRPPSVEAGPPVTELAGDNPAQLACSLPKEQLLRIWHGSRTDRGGQIQIVPRAPNYMGGGYSHAGPWDYVQRVPIFFYGPGYIRPAGRIDSPVTLADIAPTEAALLDYPLPNTDGRALDEALVRGERRARPPKLIVTMVWDGGGRNVLATWPDSWPVLQSLMPEGAWFENASLGSSPSNTPPTHATIGTGSFPMHHGILDLYQRKGGYIAKPQGTGPDQLILPTLADVYDRAMDNRPVVGIVATLGAHTGMIGHGAMWAGGDRDILVLREKEDALTGGAEGGRWDSTSGMRPFFRFPPYINDIGGFDDDIRALDQADGALDGLWGTHSIEQLQMGFKTPARVTYQNRIVKQVIEREGFGADDVPDLLFVNFKAIDTIGHLYSLNSGEIRDTLKEQDRLLGDLIGFLNRQVGRDEWVLALTADHGHQFDPEITGAFPIGVGDMTRFLRQKFEDREGEEVVEQLRPTQLWVNKDELRGNGYTLTDVAMTIARATKADTIDKGSVVDPDEADELVFAAAFPTSVLSHLPCLPEARER